MVPIASSRIKEPTGYIILCSSSSISSKAGVVLLSTFACSQGTKSCGRACCLTCSSEGHIHYSSFCSVGLCKVVLVETSDSSIAPQYGGCFFSTLEGFDKALQEVLNHCVKDA